MKHPRHFILGLCIITGYFTVVYKASCTHLGHRNNPGQNGCQGLGQCDATKQNGDAATAKPQAPGKQNADQQQLEPVQQQQQGHLNVILSPTAGQVSEESQLLLTQMENGLSQLRQVLQTYSRLSQLLSAEDRNATFAAEGEEWSIALLLGSLNRLVSEGEKQQRILIQATAEFVTKLVTPKPQS